jgi:hypothetical protein
MVAVFLSFKLVDVTYLNKPFQLGVTATICPVQSFRMKAGHAVFQAGGLGLAGHKQSGAARYFTGLRVNAD